MTEKDRQSYAMTVRTPDPFADAQHASATRSRHRASAC